MPCTGLTGILVAMCTLTHQAAAAVNSLRNMNAYVSSTLADWPAKDLHAVVPRQLAPGTEIEGSRSVGELLSSICIKPVRLRNGLYFLMPTSRRL